MKLPTNYTNEKQIHDTDFVEYETRDIKATLLLQVAFISEFIQESPK
jgi:hypothetical protein